MQFSTKGIESVQAAIVGLQKGLTQVQAGVNAVGQMAESAFNKATGALRGWIQAGLSSSSVGEVLAFQMEALSRNIAGLFNPEIQKAIELIQQATNWFRSLDDAQRENIVSWIKGGLAGLAVAAVLPKVFAGLVAVTGAVKALAVGMLTLNVSTGGILAALGAVATAVAAVFVGFQVAQGGIGGFGDIFKALQPIIESVGKVLLHLWEAVQPAVSAFVKFFEIIAGAVASVMPAITQAMGSVGAALQKVAEALAPVIIAFAQLFAENVQQLEPLISLFAEWALLAADTLAPALQAIGLLTVWLSKVIGGPMIDAIVKLAKIIMTVLKPQLEILAFLFRQVARGGAWLTGVDLNAQAEVAVQVARPDARPARGGRNELPARSSGFEAIEAAWSRIAQAAIKVGTGKPPEERAADALDRIERIDENVLRELRERLPLFAGR